MKSILNITSVKRSNSLVADDIIEFHAARILLLILNCGSKNRIDGLTKLAKLDFFVRYPKFFSIACKSLGIEYVLQHDEIESQMIRFHYGPWDKRYYDVFGYLKGKGLIAITKKGKTVIISLTENGNQVAFQLSNDLSFAKQVKHMSAVKKVIGTYNGSRLKQLVYRLFDAEVANLQLGETIK